MGDKKVIYSTSAPGISKLKESANYASWKFDMKMALKYEGLWNCIEPRNNNTETTPLTVDPDKDERAHAKIAMHLEAAPKLHIRTAISAKEAWDILAKQYEVKSTNRRIFLLDQLLDLKLEVCNSMSEYISKFLDLNAQLADIEKPVDDEMKACLLLRGLPESYRAFRMAVESTDKVEYLW
ncbi:uncharacterized protein LOC128984719 [Macrosteles quadrilineatus]|uniref:uncharacterized protein LOC128984719 n=1 Tax=Macrosteles quadrilineatus TaxID=74068 RepID=UPI0023E255EF|nr:uncharacterized protein LOC128984719 [Macrosteles quadrilineatus]